MTSEPVRRRARSSPKTTAKILRRMIHGTFTVTDLCEVSGLCRQSVWKLVNAFLAQEAIYMCGYEPRAPGERRPPIRRFQLVRL